MSILNKFTSFLFHKKRETNKVLLNCQHWIDWLVKGYTGARSGMKQLGCSVPPVQLHLLQTSRPLRRAEARAALARLRQALLQMSLRPESHCTRPAASQTLHVRKLSMLLVLLYHLSEQRVILPVNQCVSGTAVCSSGSVTACWRWNMQTTIWAHGFGCLARRRQTSCSSSSWTLGESGAEDWRRASPAPGRRARQVPQQQVTLAVETCKDCYCVPLFLERTLVVV